MTDEAHEHGWRWGSPELHRRLFPEADDLYFTKVGGISFMDHQLSFISLLILSLTGLIIALRWKTQETISRHIALITRSTRLIAWFVLGFLTVLLLHFETSFDWPSLSFSLPVYAIWGGA